MRRTFIRPMLTMIALASGVFLLSACHRSLVTSHSSVVQEETPGATDLAVAVPPRRKDGARAWAQNCMRCHNARDPQERSDREWEVIVHHMRVRANLTADEHRLIVEFLKAAN